MHFWQTTALIWAGSTALSCAQMAEQPAVDLEKGLVSAQKSLDDQGQLAVGTERKFSDLTLCFTFDQRRADPEHPTCFLRLPGDETQVTLQAAGEDRVLLNLAPDAAKWTGVHFTSGLLGRHRMALCIKRDRREALSGLWVDGVERLSFALPPGVWDYHDTPVDLKPGGPGSANIQISDIRLYNRALSRAEIMALAQEDVPRQTDHKSLALIGGSEAVAMAESGWLDAMLSLIRAKDAPALRDLAWEGDTVFQQQRPLNFGSIPQQLARVQARRALIMLGRQECMELGAAGVPAFREALTLLVQQCPRGVVIAGAVPFEKMTAPLPDLSPKNQDLRLYDEAMRTVAQENGGTFIDVARSWRKQEEGWTRDGLTLNDHGALLLADIIAFDLGNNRGPDPGEADLGRLRSLGREKQALWHRYWRPANWAFLYGDRTTQPSSRDHLSPNVRWFPQELEQYRMLIDAKENELWKLSQELGRKLP